MCDTAIFLGVGRLQIEAIRAAKKLGFHTIGFDVDNNAAGKNSLDEFFNISGIDHDAILKALSPKDIDLKFVWANNDIFIKTRCILEEHYELSHPRIGLEIANKILDKLECKNFFPSPLHIPIYDKLTLKKANYSFFITKPLNGSGSFGVRLVTSREVKELVRAGHLVEPYLEGQEFGLNCFSDDQVIWFESVKRYFNHTEDFIPRGTALLTPTSEPEILSTAKSKLERFIKRYNLRGALKFDLMIDKFGDPFIIEFSPRLHGEIDTSLVLKVASKISQAERYFGLVTHRDTESYPVEDNNSCAGYISIFNEISIDEARKITAEFCLEFEYEVSLVDSLVVGAGNSEESEGKSTASIKQYLFYVSNILIREDDFLILNERLNNA